MNEKQIDSLTGEEIDSKILMALSDWEINSDIESGLADSIQSAFEALSSSSLIYKGDYHRQNLGYCIRKVAKDPADLTSHVRRFYLAMLLRSKTDVLGALVDLIIMLRFKGNTLVERLIKETSPVLDADDQKQLVDVLNRKSAKAVLNVDITKSVLVNGRCLPAVFKNKDKKSMS